jgi:hypothetical protein
MIRKTNETEQGLSVAIVAGFLFLFVAFFLFLMFNQAFVGFEESAETVNNDTHYEEESGNMIRILGILSGTGLLVVPVLMYAVDVIVTAIRETNGFR